MPIVEKKVKDLVRILKTENSELKYHSLEFVENPNNPNNTSPDAPWSSDIAMTREVQEFTSTTTLTLIQKSVLLDKKLVSSPRYVDDLFERIAFDSLAKEAMLDKGKDSKLAKTYTYSDDFDHYENAMKLKNRIFAASSGLAYHSRFGPAQYVVIPNIAMRLLSVKNHYSWISKVINKILSKLRLVQPFDLSAPLDSILSAFDVIIDPRLTNADDSLIILGRYVTTGTLNGLTIGIQNYDTTKVKGLGKVVVHYGVVNAGNLPYGSVSMIIPDSDKKAQEWCKKK